MKRTPEQRRSGVFVVNCENISHLFLLSLLLTLNMCLFAQYAVAITATLYTSGHIIM